MFLFYFHSENAYSDKASIIYGVPKGLILGSLLFLFYINNEPQAVDSERPLYVVDPF